MAGDDRQLEDLARLARDAVVGRVACELAHDINDLLVGVLAGEDEAASAGTAADLRRALRSSAECGRRIAELVRAFQALFARGHAPAGAASADLTDAIDQALALCRKRISIRGIEVRRNSGTLPMVRADLGSVEHVILELLDAALELLPCGGALELTTSEQGESVTLTVSCSGTGPARADGGRRSGPCPGPEHTEGGSSGPDRVTRRLQWTAAEYVVRRCGGGLTAHQAPGKGPAFTLRLPVCKAIRGP